MNESLLISVLSRDSLYFEYSDVSPLAGEAICVLEIPNQLLYMWREEKEAKKTYVRRANEAVIDGMVQLRDNADLLEMALRNRSYDVMKRYQKCTGGRKRAEILAQSSHIFVKRGELVSVLAITTERNEACERAREFQSQLGDYAAEVEALKSLIRAEKELMEVRGKSIDQVGRRQQQRKLSDFKTKAQHALWFAELFGITVNSLNISFGETTTGVQMEQQESEDDQQVMGNSHQKNIVGTCRPIRFSLNYYNHCL